MNRDPGSQNYVEQFLFGDSRVECDSLRATSSMIMDMRTEGWVGIPHGGIAMGSILELAFSLELPGSGALKFPLSAEFRLGGSRAKIGDVMSVDVRREPDCYSGRSHWRKRSPVLDCPGVCRRYFQPDKRAF